jgi:drug/metabolite transporter (DMT)-like permease
MKNPEPRSNPGQVTAALLTIQVIYGVHYLVAKWIVAEISPAAWACLRTLLSSAILLIIFLAGRRRLPGGRALLQLGICSLFGVILNQALFLEGIARTTAGHAALMNSQIPTFALLGSILIGQEKFSWRKGVSFLVGSAGVLILLQVDRLQFGSETLTGDLLTLANTVSFSIFIVLSRRIMSKEDPLAATTVIFGFASVGMLAWGGDDLLRTDLTAISPLVIGGMVFAILLATILTYFLNIWALKRTRVSHVALYIFLQPVIAAVLGLLLLHEAVSIRLVISTALVFVALLLQGSSRSASPDPDSGSDT